MDAAMAMAVPLLASAKDNHDLFGALEEAGLIHQSTDFGFFSILSKKAGECSRQNSFRLSQMHEVLPLLPMEIDTWMSQCEFIKPNRRIINLARIPLLFVDLDCYSMTPQKALSTLLWHCDEIGLPHPSITIFSGRGLQAKWLLDKPLPRWALPRWNQVQSQLVQSFALLGADMNAKDASRVLRLVNTTNTKSNEKVQVLHTTNDSAGQPARYGFEYAAEILLSNSRDFYDKKKNNHPYTEDEKLNILASVEKKHQEYLIREARRNGRPELKLIQGNNTTGLNRFSGRQLAWHRLEDIRKLFEIRGGVKQGQSMATLFWALNFLLLSGATNSSQMFYEAKSLSLEFGFGEFNRSDELSTLYAKAKDNDAGKTIEFDGRQYPALYTPKNSSLIDTFGITDDEQRQLRTIISTDMARERHAERSRASRHASGENKMTRDEYVSVNEEKRTMALKMKLAGKSIREIAASLNASKSSVDRWVS